MAAPPLSVAAPSSPPSVVATGAWQALLLLILINLFNYIDRQVLAAVEPSVRAEFFPPVLDPQTGEIAEPPDAKALMGFLSFAFLATYMFLAPVFGALATRMSRWLLIAIGVIVWSLASGASGLAPWLEQVIGLPALALFGFAFPGVYLIMLVTRCCVGVGEAVYGPVAPDVISDLYSVDKRGQILAWFYAAIPFGGALGYALGDLTVRVTGDWRWAFYLVVPPGILLGIWCLFLPEPPRGQSDQAIVSLRKPQWSDYLFLLRIPSYSLNLVGMTFMCFAMGALAFWAPGYLEHRQVAPMLGIPPKTFFGLLTAVLGLIATLLGGIAGDALRERWSGSYFLVSGFAMCVGAPLLVLMVLLPFPLAWLPLAGFVFCLFFNTGPTNAINANVCHPLLRARGFAFNILIIHLLGDAASPTIIGAIIGQADRYDLAFHCVAFTVLLGGLFWMCGAWYLKRDTERAPKVLPD